VGIALSDPEVFAPTTSRIAPNFDRFFTNASQSIPEYKALGVEARLLPPATNDEFFRPVPPRLEFACDVLILGSAHPDRIEPVRVLAAEFNVHVYGDGWDAAGLASRGFLYGDDSLSALNSAAITMVFSRTRSGHANIKVALFDFLAAGAFVMTDYQPELGSYFDVGQELIAFSSTEEMLQQVRHFLETGKFRRVTSSS